jgi:methylglutaconyl-CoA hydratase
MGLASVCDVLLACDNVTFCLSEARLGLLPATIGPYVVRAMGEQASRRYFTTAERFSCRAGLAMGFVHELCARDELDARVANDRFGPGGQRPCGGARLQAAGPRRGGQRHTPGLD